MEPTKIFGFWHVAEVGNWNNIVPMQWEKLKKSGLYDATEKLYINDIGVDDRDRSEGILPEEIIKDSKIVISRMPTRYSFEFPTLKIMQDVARDRSDVKYFYYIHVKGAMTANPLAYFSDDPKDKNPAYWWGQYMEHYIIWKWKDCVDKIDEGADICGVEWRHAPLVHFSGNMWWASRDYILRLPDAQTWWDKHKTDRIMAEMYIGTGGPKAYCFKNTGQDLYRYAVTPDQWS